MICIVNDQENKPFFCYKVKKEGLNRYRAMAGPNETEVVTRNIKEYTSFTWPDENLIELNPQYKLMGKRVEPIWFVNDHRQITFLIKR